MAALMLLLQGMRIHAGFYRDETDWQFDPVDTYVVDDRGSFVAAVDDPDRLGEIDDDGCFHSLRALAEVAANDNVVEAWESDQLVADREIDRHRD